MAIALYGTVNTTAQITPGVLVQRMPPAVASLNGVPSNILGAVGGAPDGPIGVAVTCGSMADYANNFGAIQNIKHDLGTFAATATLQGASNFRFVRAVDGSQSAAHCNATVTVANVVSTGATLTSIYTGSNNNNLTVSFGTGSKASSIRAVVAKNGASEVYDNLPSDTTFWTNFVSAINIGQAQTNRAKSNYVTATIGNATVAPTLPSSFTFSGATDGTANLTPAMLLGDPTAKTGMYALTDQGCAVIALVDCDDGTTWGAQDSFASTQGAMSVVCGPSGDTIANAITTKHTVGIDSAQTKVLFGNYKLWNDTVNGLQRYVSDLGFYCGARTNLSPNASTLNATGGQFPINGILGQQKVNGFSNAESDQLIAAGIDLIAPSKNGGSYWCVIGGCTSSSNAASVDETNTTMGNYVDTTFNAGMGQFVGLQASPTNLTKVAATLNDFASRMKSAGMLSLKPDGSLPWTIVCSAVNNPAANVGLGYIQADITIHTDGTIRHLLLNTQVGSTV